MATTYTPIATTTLGSASASYTFSSIPSTYTDLILVAQGTDTLANGDNWSLQFNGDTGTNYSATRLRGDNLNNADSSRTTSASNILGIQMSDTIIGQQIYQIQNYSNTTTYKTALLRGGSTYVMGTAVGLWRSTAAINAIKIFPNGGNNFKTASTFTLYGIKAA